jgi:hypothetical protein
LAEEILITVTAPIWLWSEGKGSWHFLTIPPDEAVEIRLASAASGVRRGFGSVPVEAANNGGARRPAILPQKSGGYILPIKADVRKRTGVAAGDEVTLSLNLL